MSGPRAWGSAGTSPTPTPTSSAAPLFREWFLGKVREHTMLKEEQARASRLEVVPDLDEAVARGAAIAALEIVRAR